MKKCNCEFSRTDPSVVVYHAWDCDEHRPKSKDDHHQPLTMPTNREDSRPSFKAWYTVGMF